METKDYPNIAFVRAICEKEKLKDKIIEFRKANISLNYTVKQETMLDNIDNIFDFETFDIESVLNEKDNAGVLLSYIIKKEQRVAISNGTKNEVIGLPDNLFYSLKLKAGEAQYELNPRNKAIVEKVVNLIDCARAFYEKLPATERCEKCTPDYLITAVSENSNKAILRYAGPRTFVDYLQNDFLKESNKLL